MIMSGGDLPFKRRASRSVCLIQNTPLNSSSHVHEQYFDKKNHAFLNHTRGNKQSTRTKPVNRLSVLSTHWKLTYTP
jgi:hypothetical protein